MTVFKSRVDTSSDAFAKNRREMLGLIDKLGELNGRGARLSEQRKARFESRGQLTPRQRMNALLDPGMPFLAIGNLAGYLQDTEDEPKSIPGSTCITGIGFIAGIRCAIAIDDSGITAGALTVASTYRLLRTQEIALQQKIPFVHLVESGGADLFNYKVEHFMLAGTLFGNQAKLSKAGVPVVSVLHGSSTAGGAYMPGLSDYVVAIKGRGRAFLAGPPLLKAATGEIAGEEELGGAEMHATTSGLAEYLAEDDRQGLVIAREVVGRLNWARHRESSFRRNFEEPVYSPDEIAGVIPVDYRTPYDIRELAARLVDGSKILDFKSRYGVATVCMQADICGMPCGIVGNNGPIDPEGATKAAQFLQLCEQANVPVVFLQNTTGFLVGVKAEQAGIIKHGSKLVQAVQNLEVPRLTLMTGASFGAGNYGMCGRGYNPDFLYAFPNSTMGVMGGEQAAKTLSEVTRAKTIAAGKDVNEEQLKDMEAGIVDLFDSQSSAFYCSGNMMDDGVIDPRDARKTLGFLLETVTEARQTTPKPNSFGVARM